MRQKDTDEEQIIPDQNIKRSLGPIALFKIYSSKVNWIVFCLICFFTLGSWIDLSGIWSELPLMVDELPEGWRLPAIISAITQASQIGTLFFLLARCLAPKVFSFVKAIYFIFVIGLISCLFLAFFWNQTERIYQHDRSIYLYISNFLLSLLDGMSTVTFLPYIGGHYTKEYIIPNYIGESLSSVIPATLSMIQGYKKTINCTLYHLSNKSNVSDAFYTKVTMNYSVSIYFFFMFILLLISLISFSILNHSKTAIGARKLVFESFNDIVLTERNTDSSQNNNSVSISNITFISSDKRKEIYALITLAFFVSFLFYGFLPGLISYSTLPYGDTYFHLAINLSYIFLPVSIVISIWSYSVSLRRIFIEFLIAFLLSVYIIIIAFSSPCPIFLNSSAGGVIIVIAWILTNGLFMRIRCLISTTLEIHGQKMLFLCGYANILGQIIGGLLIFGIVDTLRLLKEKEQCSPNRCY